MQHIFQGNKFGRAIKQKRVIDLDLDMRSLGKKLDISAATISRAENAKFIPDVITYSKLCAWMGVPLTEFIKTTK